MKTWTTVTGYPYLKVTEEKWSNDSVTITLEQNRFLSDGSVDEASSSTLWSIPLLFASEGNASDEAVIMDKKVQTFTIPISSSSNTKVRISDIFVSCSLLFLFCFFFLCFVPSSCCFSFFLFAVCSVCFIVVFVFLSSGAVPGYSSLWFCFYLCLLESLFFILYGCCILLLYPYVLLSLFSSFFSASLALD
jgi:hypothetical protein